MALTKVKKHYNLGIVTKALNAVSMILSTDGFFYLREFVTVNVKEYATKLVCEQKFAVRLGPNQRQDLVLWVLEQEYPEVSRNDRYNAMMCAMESQWGCSNTPQLFSKCACCGVEIERVFCSNCKSDGA